MKTVREGSTLVPSRTKLLPIHFLASQYHCAPFGINSAQLGAELKVIGGIGVAGFWTRERLDKKCQSAARQADDPVQ